MTVLPFVARAPRADDAPARSCVVAVTGSFRAPSGRVGAFRGSYRLEHLVRRAGQLHAAGVFTGELVDADGSRVGLGARRRTLAVVAVRQGPALQLRLASPDVDLLGLRVALDEVTVDLVTTLGAAKAGRCP